MYGRILTQCSVLAPSPVRPYEVVNASRYGHSETLVMNGRGGGDGGGGGGGGGGDGGIEIEKV